MSRSVIDCYFFKNLSNYYRNDCCAIIAGHLPDKTFPSVLNGFRSIIESSKQVSFVKSLK